MGGFPNRNAGYSHVFTDTTGRYTIVFTHIQESLITREGPSGTRIGALFPMGNTHLHLEFSANGVWQRPELYFCR